MDIFEAIWENSENGAVGIRAGKGSEMKKYVWSAVLALVWAGVAMAAPGKIGTVDLDKVFDAHPKTVQSAADLKVREAEAMDEMKQLEEKQKALMAEVDAAREAAKSPLLSAEVRAEKMALAESKETEYQAFVLTARRQQESKLRAMREEVLEMRKQIVEEMQGELAVFAEAEGYALIFDKSGLTMNGVSLVAFSKPGLDVTDAFIAYIQSDKPTAPAAAAAEE